MFDPVKYWNDRYAAGGTSGAGSFNKLAEFKAEIVNDFIKKNLINTVLELGCGDGNQLSLLECPLYKGVDISKYAIQLCKERFENDLSKKFCLMSEFDYSKAELVLSLDVLFHVVDDDEFEQYIKLLFSSSKRYVMIYASDKDSNEPYSHFRTKAFSDYIKNTYKQWYLKEFIKNKYPYEEAYPFTTSVSDFFIYEKIDI
jgi:SAM-dependent methyltransferase